MDRLDRPLLSRVRPRYALALALVAIVAGATRAEEPLDLAELLAEAEAASPAVAAARLRVRAAESVPAQRAALPDPVASLSYTNDTLTDLTFGESIMSNVTVAWTQELPYSGKRRAAGDVARAEIEIAEIGLDAARRELAVRVKTDYAELYAIDRTRALLEARRVLLDSFYETARRRYESGEGILENVLKARAELARIDASLAANAQERRTVAARLEATLGRSRGEVLGPALHPLVASDVDTEALEEAAVDRAPEVLAARAALRRDESRARAAERDVDPDFSWTAAYAHRGNLDPMVTGGIGVRVPLWRKNKQAQAASQARHEATAARHDIERVELALRSEVRDLVARAERARIEMRLYDEGVLPLARDALDAATSAYEAGKAEFTTLVADFLMVLDAEREHEMHRAEEAAALATLELLTGATLLEPGAAGASTGMEERHGDE